jgi:hypothetical protein
MSNSRLFSLHEFKSSAREILDDKRNLRDEWHETLADHAGTATRQRMRLVAKGLASHLHDTAKEIKVRGRYAVGQVSARMALLASRKLITIAKRIERKARSFQKNR